MTIFFDPTSPGQGSREVCQIIGPKARVVTAWRPGTRTWARCTPDDDYSIRKAIAQAVQHDRRVWSAPVS